MIAPVPMTVCLRPRGTGPAWTRARALVAAGVDPALTDASLRPASTARSCGKYTCHAAVTDDGLPFVGIVVGVAFPLVVDPFADHVGQRRPTDGGLARKPDALLRRHAHDDRIDHGAFVQLWTGHRGPVAVYASDGGSR